MIATSPSRPCVFAPDTLKRINGQAHPEPPTCITVLLTGRNMTLIRDLLKPHEDIEIVTQARDGRQAVKLAAMLSPDVILMDIDMSVTGGISAVPEILAACPEIKIIMFSVYVKQTDAEESFRAGAVGFVGKHAAAELPASIRAAYRGRFFFTP